MKNKFRLFVRSNGTWYAEDCDTGKQESLRTKDRTEADRLLNAKNEAYKNPTLNLALGKTYLAAHDPKLVSRTWEAAFELWASIGRKDSTKLRKAKAIKTKAFSLLRDKPITQTTSDDLLTALKAGGTADNKFLRDVHNLALNSGWLAWPIVAPNAWPKYKYGDRRAITKVEHEKILAVEPMAEWRSYYALLWEVGCSQTDGANLTADCVEWSDKPTPEQRGTLAYQRGKSGSPAAMSIGPRLEVLLRTLVKEGPLFPALITMTEKSRATHFKKRTSKLGLEGVTLHSYRYTWAERGAKTGYPERWAKAALGHESSAVHRHYAKKAKVICPSLEEYERKIIQLPQPESQAKAQ